MSSVFNTLTEERSVFRSILIRSFNNGLCCEHRQRWSLRRITTLLTTLMAIPLLTGCGSLNNAKMKETLAPLFHQGPTAQQEEQHRQDFQSSRDPKSLNWLLANRIDAGMTVKEVGGIIGEQGTRVNGGTQIKSNSGNYQSTDEVWRWRAARDGQAIHLVFRQGRLVNYDPSKLREEEW